MYWKHNFGWPAGGTKSLFRSVGTYARRDGGRGSSWSAQVPAVTHRETYSEPRGGQSNFARGPLPSRQPQASKDAFTRTQLILKH